MSAQPREPLTAAQFIDWVLGQELKHEFVEGHVSALPGGTIEHHKLTRAIFRELSVALLGSPNETYVEMMVTTGNSVRFPDIAVTSDERDDVPGTVTLRHPKSIVEILSESTANEDLGPKLREYQAIDSLEEYLTIDSRKRWAQLMRRTNGDWVLALPVSGGQLELRSVGVTLDLDELYAEAEIG